MAAAGFSLVELLVAMTIGIGLLLGMVVSFSNASRSQKELDQAGQLIENGRYAVDLLYDDIRHAGYYGHWQGTDSLPASLPDPCETALPADIEAGMAFPVQGYDAGAADTYPNLTGVVGCNPTWLPQTNLSAGSDIIAIRRADTVLLSGSPTAGEVYLQANTTSADIQIGVAGTDITVLTADALPVTLTKVDGTTPADIRKFHTRVYFVAPCRDGSGTGGVCLSGDDTIPTLKRLELTASGGVTALSLVPLIEGVEYLNLSYGIDNSPTDVDEATGLVGDGVPDTYSDAPALGEWPSVVSVKVWMLVRNLKSSRGHVDDKGYLLGGPGGLAIAAIGDGYRRHVFGNEVRLINASGRRERLE
ncbi:MAG: PilW family protein [Magnetococcales bacterium]|nr:PilW family protein [Magnetococcales bacterium]